MTLLEGRGNVIRPTFEPAWGSAMGSISLFVVFAIVWVLIALVPMRTPSASRAWAMGVLGISVLIVLVAALYGASVKVGIGYGGPSPMTTLMLVSAITVAPGVIVALVRQGKNR